MAAAQDCQGFVPYPGRPVHFFVRGAFDSHTSLYGGGLGVGNAAAFGELDVEGVSTDAIGPAAFAVGVGGGLQLPLNRSGTAHLCPIAQATFLLGPNDVFDFTYGPHIHYRESDYTFGGSLGFSANGAAHQVKINPMIAFAHTIAHNHFSDSTGLLLVAHSRWQETFTLGVGLLVGREVSVTPMLSHVSGGSGSSLSFGVRVAFAVGGTRIATVNSRSTSCAGLASVDSTVYDTTQVSERPVIHTAPEVLYPPMDRDLGIHGRVVLGVIVGSNGAPDTAAVYFIRKVDPGIDREALRWIGGVMYWPACREGRPVRARIAQPLDFCLGGCAREQTR